MDENESFLKESYENNKDACMRDRIDFSDTFEIGLKLR